jgi:hypothetical protein
VFLQFSVFIYGHLLESNSAVGSRDEHLTGYCQVRSAPLLNSYSDMAPDVSNRLLGLLFFEINLSQTRKESWIIPASEAG